jgi:hypothetical protein
MKVAVVDPKHLTSRLDLRASTYADPTRHIDREIRRTEATIHDAHKRLKVLQEEHARILRGHEPHHILNEQGHLRRDS